jgi:hypothetical protein
MLLVACFIAPAAAQDEASTERQSPRLTVTEERNGATRISLETAPIPIVVRMEMPPSTMCAAELALTFQQRNTFANIKGDLENATCAASSGEYTLAISVVGDDGLRQTVEFSEAWQRDDDRPYTFEHDYPIGENVELVSVRSRRVSCTCTATPAVPE